MGLVGLSQTKYSREMLDSVFSLDSSIRSFSIIAEDGRIIFAKMRDGLAPLAPEESIEDYSIRAALRLSIGNIEDNHYGRTTSILISRERLSMMMFPFDRVIVIVTARANFPCEKVKLVKRLVESFSLG